MNDWNVVIEKMAGKDHCANDQSVSVSCSPMPMGLLATIDAAIANIRTILLCGASQYSALLGTNFSSAMLLESKVDPTVKTTLKLI